MTPINEAIPSPKSKYKAYKEECCALEAKSDKTEADINKIRALKKHLAKKPKKIRPMWCFPIPFPKRKRVEEVPLMDEMTEIESTGALISPLDKEEKTQPKPEPAPKRFLSWRERRAQRGVTGGLWGLFGKVGEKEDSFTNINEATELGFAGAMGKRIAVIIVVVTIIVILSFLGVVKLKLKTK